MHESIRQVWDKFQLTIVPITQLYATKLLYCLICLSPDPRKDRAQARIGPGPQISKPAGMGPKVGPTWQGGKILSESDFFGIR